MEREAKAEQGMMDEAVAAYFAWMREQLVEKSDGSWLGREEHLARFEAILMQDQPIAESLGQILQQEASLVLRYEALRLAAASHSRELLLPLLDALLAPANYQPLMRRRMELLRLFWRDDQRQHLEQPTERRAMLEHLLERIRFQLWFNAPGYGFEEMISLLDELTNLGKTGCYAIEQLLYETLEERCLMDRRYLHLFQTAAPLFVRHAYYEGVQVCLDFLDACEPIKPDEFIKGAVGEILRAIRRLRPYRYPQWARPLERFAAHYRSVGQAGRAAEANMLKILITASTAEEALLLDNDELVDLLRGRRDAAYKEEELVEAAALCDAVLAAGRDDSRIFHIRGWLAARLEGEEEAEAYFQAAIERDPENVFPHLALAALYQERGEEEAMLDHLYTACHCPQTLISCHRRLAHACEEADALDDALMIYERGTQIIPTQVTDLELEEFFSCLAGVARLLASRDGAAAGKEALEAMASLSLTERFGARFVRRKKTIIELFARGLRELHAELSPLVEV
jgi:tetratricopeptide (TPR) repeat protein